MSALLSLNCYVLGDDPRQTFPVDIVPSATVGHLKKAVKAEKSHAFENVDADALDVWKVSLPADSNLKEAIRACTFVREESLLPADELSDVFSESPPRKHVHIVVGRPLHALQYPSTRLQEEIEKEDAITALCAAYENTLTKILTAKSPSESAKSSEYRNYQQNFPIYDGRYAVKAPTDTIAPPIQLFHPVFGLFLDDLKSDTPAPDEVVKATARYMRAASGIYDSEHRRKNAIRPYLSELFGMEMATWINTDKTSADALIEISLTRKVKESATIFVGEDKKEFGDGGSDPSIQAGLSMSRYWAQPEHQLVRENTCCPTFLFANAGPWFAILGAVFSNKVIVQRLTDYIWVGMDSTLNEPHCKRVAHIMHSFQRNLRILRRYYLNLEIPVIKPDEVHPRFFPSITAYRDEGGEVVSFKYTRFLEDDPTCITLLAQTLSNSRKQVVVKFVQRYGDGPHRVLAEENLAPKLLYYGQIGIREGDPSYGHLSMVVMEYVDGTTLLKAEELEQVPKDLEDRLRIAFKHLHDNNFVFGDLRPPNVMITKNGDVKLIDFDWAGIHMKTKYPLLISSRVAWPEKVEGLSIMKKEHDDDMLAKLLKWAFPRT